MKLNYSIRVSSLAVIATAMAIAQPVPVKNADDQWLDLLKLTAPQPRQSSPGQVKKTASQLQRERDDQAVAARAVERAAKDFYLANPGHGNAAEAKRMEIIFGLQGVTDGDPAHEQAVQSRARAYRSDLSNSVVDRFEVALLAERIDARKKTKGQVDMQNTAEQERIAEKLRAEYGSFPAVDQYYLTIARSADRATARRLATALSQSSSDAPTREEALSILAREEMVGKPLDVKLSSIDGKLIDLAQPDGVMRLVYVCSYGSGATHSLSGMGSFKKALPANTQVIYLVLGASPEQAASLVSLASVPGIFCVDNSEPAVAAARKLHVHRAPYAFLVNSSGALSSFGPAGEIGRMIASSGR